MLFKILDPYVDEFVEKGEKEREKKDGHWTFMNRKGDRGIEGSG